MAEPAQLPSSEKESTVRLREEYLALLSNNFLDLPYVIASASADHRKLEMLRPTAGEYERLMDFYREGAIPPAQAARSAEVYQAVFDRLRRQAGPPGTPMSAEDLERYDHQHGPEIVNGTDFGILGIMGWLSRQVELDLAQLRLDLPYPVFVGEYPTGDFNACSCPSPSGVLVLVNRGLFVFIYLMAKLYALSVHYDFPSPGSVSVRIGEEGLVLPSDAPYAKVTIIDHVIDALMSYLLLRQPTKAQRLPPLGGARGLVAATLTTQSEKFVLAHEYGHIVAGHITSNLAVPQPTVGEGVRLVPISHAKEFQADGYGAAVMVTRDGTAQGIGGGELGWHQAVAAGTAFFFALADLIRRFEEAGGAPRLTDHPLPAERWNLLRPGFALTSGPAALSMAEGCIAWTQALIPEIQTRMTEVTRNVNLESSE
jgi:hypothetical protein